MIHVAPCQCELHVRIRELEAELARRLNDAMNWKARAEKAENAEASARFEWGSWEHRAQVAEARVAALAELEQWWHETFGNYPRKSEPAPAIEGQEREAD